MPALKYRLSNQWRTQGSTPSLTVSNLQPSVSGTTQTLPFVFSFNTSDNSRVAKVELYYLVGSTPTKLGETTSPGYGWAVPVPSNLTPGTYNFFGRATDTLGASFDGPQISTTIQANAGPVTLSWVQPSADGQTYQFPFTAAFSSSDNSRVTKVELFKSLGPEKMGEATTPNAFGYTISIAEGVLNPSTYNFFGRATLTDGGVVSTATRSVILTDATPPPPTGSRTLKQAIAFGGEEQHAPKAEARLGRRFQVRMRFVVRATPAGCISDLTNQIDDVIARRTSNPYMMWLTIGLVMNNDSGGLLATANGQRNATLWDDVGDQFNRLTATDLATLVGIRLGHEFMNAGDDYRWGVRNTTINSTDVLLNATRFRGAWQQAVNTIKSRLNSQAKKDALQLDWNSPGGQMIRQMTHSGVNAWTLADACYPGDAYVTVITTDIYDQDRFRPNHSGSAVKIPINGPDSPLTYVRTRAIQHGKKSGMSEGSPFMFKFKPGTTQIGTDDGSATVTFLNDLLDWGQTEASAGRLSHITFFERDPDPEGFTAFIGGQSDLSARSFGEERRDGLWRLIHPRENNIPGGIPAGASGVPNTLSRRATVYTAVGGSRTRSVHTNAPQTLNALLDRVGGAP